MGNAPIEQAAGIQREYDQGNGYVGTGQLLKNGILEELPGSLILGFYFFSHTTRRLVCSANLLLTLHLPNNWNHTIDLLATLSMMEA
jgi:hypothetical protein